MNCSEKIYQSLNYLCYLSMIWFYNFYIIWRLRFVSKDFEISAALQKMKPAKIWPPYIWYYVHFYWISFLCKYQCIIKNEKVSRKLYIFWLAHPKDLLPSAIGNTLHKTDEFEYLSEWFSFQNPYGFFKNSCSFFQNSQ